MEKNSKYNAQKTNTRRTKGEFEFDDNPHDKEDFEADSSIIGDEPERTDRALGQGGEFTIAKTTIGGILDRLRTLQTIHLQYVEAHGKRLEQRLIENHTHKSKVFEEMHYLEVELVHLLQSTKEEEVSPEEE